jgi:hypothetical protein
LSEVNEADERDSFNGAFDPQEIEVLNVVFQNIRAAIGEPVSDPATGEQIAARLFNFAMRGERNPGKLYLKTLESYQAVPSVLYVSAAPSVVP